MKFIRLRRKFIPESKSSVLRIVAHNLAARISCRGLGFDPDCLSKYFSSVEHGVHVHTLTRFQFPLIGRLTIAKKARAYVESQTHFLFAAESLHRNLVLNGIDLAAMRYKGGAAAVQEIADLDAGGDGALFDISTTVGVPVLVPALEGVLDAGGEVEQAALQRRVRVHVAQARHQRAACRFQDQLSSPAARPIANIDICAPLESIR